MADAAAKREARRRRILENSEYRLQKITGQAIHAESPDKRCKRVVDSEEKSTKSISETNGVSSDETFGGHRSVDSLINELNADIASHESNSPFPTEDDIFALLSAPSMPHRRSTARANVSGENGNVLGDFMNSNESNNVEFNSERRDILAGAPLDDADRENSVRNASPEASMLETALSSRLIYVALAIVVNIMVVSKMEHLFGTSIIVPFFVLMIGRLCACKGHDDSGGGNILVAALILSNIRPDIVKQIHRLKTSLSFLSRAFQDFAVYIFTFVIMYTIINRYWIQLGDIIPFPSESRVIINDNASM